MSTGPGKYDGEATWVQARTQAHGVLLMIIEGNKGNGFSIASFDIQATLEITLSLPKLLREMANQIEVDIKEHGLIPSAEHNLNELNKTRIAQGKKPWTHDYKGED
jgi:hypothetical protein